MRFGPYSVEMVQYLYASYVATLWGPFNGKANPANQESLIDVSVRGCRVEISSPSIRRFFYVMDTYAIWVPHTEELNYSWDVMKSGHFLLSK